MAADRIAEDSPDITGAGLDVVNDKIIVLDKSNTTDDPTGTLSNITPSQLKIGLSLNLVDNTPDASKTVSAAQAAADLAAENAAKAYADGLITALKDGVATPGNTLQKLYNLILGLESGDVVDNTAARDAYNIPQLPYTLFVIDDGDGKWAKYQAITTGVGATFVKLSDPDLLNAVMSNAAIKVAYESNADTNALTNALLTKLNGIEAAADVTDAGNVGAAIDGVSDKPTPVDGDKIGIIDFVGNVLKTITIANLKAILKSYFDSVTTTLTNKRITARVQTVTSASTVTPNADTDDLVKITAQAVPLTIANPSGTPTEGQAQLYRIKDNGTAQTIAYGSEFRAIGVTLPTTTVISKTLYIGVVRNATDSKWDVIGISKEA